MTWSPRNRSEDSTDNLDSEGETENKESENGDASVAATAAGAEKEEPGDDTSRAHSPGHTVVVGGEGPTEKITDDSDSDVEDASHSVMKGELVTSSSSKGRRGLGLGHPPKGLLTVDGNGSIAMDAESQVVAALSESNRGSDLTTKESRSSSNDHTHNNNNNNNNSSSNNNNNNSSNNSRTTNSNIHTSSSSASSRNDRDSTSPVRPKIWSVSQFLVNSPSSSSNESNSSSSSPVGGASNGSAAKVVPTVFTSGSRLHPSPGYLYLQSASQTWNGGRYGALSAYPISMSHTTLSYPYSLSTHTNSKTSLGVAASAVHSAASVELLHSAEKLASSQKGLFSPGRDIDGMRNRLFQKEAAKYF